MSTTVLGVIATFVGAIATAIGAIIAYFSFWRARGETIRQCLEFLCNPDFTAARMYVQKEDNIDPNNLSEENKEKVLLVVTTFQLWAILEKKRYLPLSLFKDSDIGVKVCGCYEHLEDYIKYRRRKSSARNPHYAEDFEKLYEKIRPSRGA